MKTATIRIYHIFGTKKAVASDISYRGKRLHSFEGEVLAELVESSRAWIQAQGFTHIKYIYG